MKVKREESLKMKKEGGSKEKERFGEEKMVNLQFTMKTHWCPSGVQKEQKKEGKC
jgi:hypothetical protein